MPEPGDAASDRSRLLLPVLGLEVTRAWDIGPLRIHPAAAVPELAAEAQHAGTRTPPRGSGSTLTGPSPNSGSGVSPRSRSAAASTRPFCCLQTPAVLRAVQHSPVSADRIQTLGSPGQATSALISYSRCCITSQIAIDHGDK